MPKKIIFQSGFPRACSTLLCNILAQNPNIKGGETSPLLEFLYGARNNFSTVPEVKSALTEDVMHKSFLDFCKGGINGYAEAMAGDTANIYLDKSRGWIHYSEFLKEFYPEAKIIVMVRDIRAVLSSFEKKWRDNPSIVDKNDNPSQGTFVTVDNRCDHWLSNPPLGIALKRLYNAHQTKTLENMLVVKAEDLCKNPKNIMQKVYEFIGEPYYDCDYSNIKQKTIENDRISDFGIYGSHTIQNNIQPLKKDWDELLGTAICNNIKANYKWFYEAFNYF